MVLLVGKEVRLLFLGDVMTVEKHEVVRMPKAVRMGAACGAIIGTIAIATASFVLSFTALTELVVEYSSAGKHAWMWAIALDGLIVVASMALVAMAGESARSRAWAFMLLIGGVMLSTVANVTHSVLGGYGPIGAIIAAVPPLMLAAITHLTVQLLRNAMIERERTVALRNEILRAEEERMQEELRAEEERESFEKIMESGFTDEYRSEAFRWIQNELSAGHDVTGEGIAERFGCSASTGRRWKNRVLENMNAQELQPQMF